MGISKPQPRLTVDEYLHGEPMSEVRHEYVDGSVFAMAGSSRNHNAIALNIAGGLQSRLGEGPCQTFISDVKVRVLAYGKDAFYYPDVMVGCDQRDTDPHYLRFPRVIVEVLSRSTERLDRNEKFLRYITIPTLEEYFLVEQSRPAVTVHRRRSGWVEEVIDDPQAVIKIESLGLELPLSSFYAGVTPVEEPGGETPRGHYG